ncbi:MAG: hypothetical protein ABI743_11925 [bacterium]
MNPAPAPIELRELLAKAIRLLNQELDLLEPGQRGDLVRVLSELRHQVAALTALVEAQRADDALEAAVLDVIRSVDQRVWLEIASRL